MKQVTIVGLGMIGCSLGLALKQLKAPPRVVGHDNQYDAAAKAQKLKAVDRVERNPLDAVEGADLVVVATPVGTIASILETIAEAIPASCVVTDTGSTKSEILNRAGQVLPAGVPFVGGHPMTGPATAGVEGPHPSIFHGAVYCVTPSVSAPPSAVSAVVSMIQAIGAEPYFLDPVEHDGLVAGISHLPYLLSATLMRVLASQASWREMSVLAAGGFDSMTRLAGQNPKMYSDILTSNPKNVARQLDLLIDELTVVRERLVRAEPDFLKELEAAQQHRIGWEEQRRKEVAARK